MYYKNRVYSIEKKAHKPIHVKCLASVNLDKTIDDIILYFISTNKIATSIKACFTSYM